MYFVLCYASFDLSSYYPFCLLFFCVLLSILFVIRSISFLFKYIIVLCLLFASVRTTTTGWKPNCSRLILYSRASAHTQLGTTKNCDPCLLRHAHMNIWERSPVQKSRSTSVLPDMHFSYLPEYFMTFISRPANKVSNFICQQSVFTSNFCSSDLWTVSV
jgi:hypothetical protein